MVASPAYRNAPQLRLGEVQHNDGTLESLLEDVDAAKAALADAKGYLDDYLELHPLADGEYRVGRWRLGVETKRKYKTTLPKDKVRE